jgi:hypothetical protein
MALLCKQIFLVFVFCLLVKKGICAGTKGQKAHFQVEDKSGDLKITATKDLAKVTAQADSVQVVVKPGMAEYPVLKSDKPLVHVVNGVNGWNTLSFKKSSIFEKEEEKQKHSMVNPSIKRNKIDVLRRRKLKEKNLNSQTFSTRKTTGVTKSTTTIPASEKSGLQSRKLNANSQGVNSRRTSHNFRSHKGKKDDVQASKKSDFQSGEAGFRVSGTAGKLKMDVTKSETKVFSESGTVDVFLKRKSGSKSKPKLGNDVVRNSDQIVHVAPELQSGEFHDIGLRKSTVPLKRRP